MKLRLTRRANRVHLCNVAEIIEPAPEIGSGFFVGCGGDWSTGFDAHNIAAAISLKFDSSGKSPA
jgi:hypothetical protein